MHSVQVNPWFEIVLLCIDQLVQDRCEECPTSTLIIPDGGNVENTIDKILPAYECICRIRRKSRSWGESLVEAPTVLIGRFLD
jgi:hypothetical protein